MECARGTRGAAPLPGGGATAGVARVTAWMFRLGADERRALPTRSVPGLPVTRHRIQWDTPIVRIRRATQAAERPSRA